MIVYFKVYKNRIDITTDKLADTIIYYSNEDFSNSRLIISDIPMAEKAFKQALIRANVKKSYFRKDIFIIQPKENYFEDFSNVEARALEEVGYLAGADEVILYTGRDIDKTLLNKEYVMSL